MASKDLIHSHVHIENCIGLKYIQVIQFEKSDLFRARDRNETKERKTGRDEKEERCPPVVLREMFIKESSSQVLV